MPKVRVKEIPETTRVASEVTREIPEVTRANTLGGQEDTSPQGRYLRPPGR